MVKQLGYIWVMVGDVERGSQDKMDSAAGEERNRRRQRRRHVIVFRATGTATEMSYHQDGQMDGIIR